MNADAGAGDAAPQTVGDQCMQEFDALCSQAINRCGVAGFSVDQCVAADMSMCCSGSGCAVMSTSSAAAVDACIAAIDAEDCNDIVNNAVPAACQGVP
jgi:hypothetical protein